MKNGLLNLFLLIALVGISVWVFGQNHKIDSLKNHLKEATHDTSSVTFYLKIGQAFEDISADSSMAYYNRALTISDIYAPDNLLDKPKVDIQTESLFRLKAYSHQYIGDLHTNNGELNNAIESYSKAIQIREKINDKEGLFNSLNQMGIAYYYLGDFEKAIEQFTRELEISNLLNDRLKVARSYTNLGVIYRNQGFFDKALENYLNSLKVYEELNHTQGLSTCYNNIGVIHWSQQNFDRAVEYYQKSLDIYLKTGDKRGMAKAYNNIGVVYDDKGEADQAAEHYQKALAIYVDLNDKHGMSACYNNIGVIYKNLADSAKSQRDLEVKADVAIENYKKSLRIALDLGDKNGIAMTNANLSSLYLLLGEKTKKTDYLKQAVSYGKIAFNISSEIGSIPYQNDASGHLLNAYALLGDSAKAFKYSEIFIKTRQQLFSAEKTKILADAEAQFETEKKQQEIDRQRILLENKELEASRQRTFRNAVIVALLLSLLMAASAYRGYSQKKAKNIIIQEKNSILEQANAEILAQRDELEAQRDMLMDQNQKLEEAHTHITDSLHYAQSIQAAILPSEKMLEAISPEYFMLMKPFQVVSGDFFWAVNIDEYRIFGVADCTGHGVPGAFMSILGLNALNDIVIRHRIVQPSQILGYLRDSVINALSQNDPDQMHKDGIDIALCTFNSKTKELHYSGAGIPMWVVVSDDCECNDFNEQYSKTAFYINNHSLFEVKPDKMPVGFAPRIKPFTHKSFSLKNCNASIYLSTDGFADQFGGIDGTKFGTTRLKNLILQNAHKPLHIQKESITDNFESWLKSYNQVDDVAILGIRL